MMKNALVLLLCSILVDIAVCQETRTESMGGVGLYMQDYTNVHVFPAALFQDPMLASIELPVAKDVETYSFGGHYRTGKHVWAVYLNRSIESSVFGLASLSPDLTLRRRAEIYYARETPQGKFGAGLTFARDALDSETSALEFNEHASDIGFKLGFSSERTDLGISFHLLDASSEEKTDSTSLEDTWGGFGFRVLNRFWLPLNENITFVPLGILAIQKTKLDPEDELKTEFDVLSLGIGAAVNLRVTENNLVVAAVEAFSVSRFTSDDKEADFKSTTTNTTLPAVFVGVESGIRPWLTGRFGVNQVYGKTETESDFGTSKTTSTTYVDNFRVVFGFGLSFGQFQLDATFNEGLLFNGPNFISGAETGVFKTVAHVQIRGMIQ